MGKCYVKVGEKKIPKLTFLGVNLGIACVTA